MSVVNQMLRDLDARQASVSERVGLPSNLRPLPPEVPARPGGWPFLAAGMLVGTLIAWLVFDQRAPQLRMEALASEQTGAAPPAHAPQQLVQAAPPAPELQQPVQAAPPTPELQQPVQAAPPASEPQQSAPATTTPVPAPMSARKTTPSQFVALVKKPERVEQAQAVVAPATPAGTFMPVAAAHIDKRPIGGTVREQAEMEYRKGMQAASGGDTVAALPALRRALEIDPRHAGARQALLSILAGSHQWDEVKQLAQAGLALDPARNGWAVILARLQHEQGDTAGAVKTLEAHAAHATGDADYQGLLAFLLQKSQRPADAAQRYHAALGLRPGEGRWWYGLGLALEAAGRGEEARTAFGRARDTGTLSADMLGIIEHKLR